MKHFLTQLLLILLIASCNSTRKQLKKAAVLEEGGLRMEAMQEYERIYRESGRPEALVGHRRIAQTTLQGMFQSAKMQCMQGNHEAALDSYGDAFAYQQRFRQLELAVPPNAESEVNECKLHYIDFLYTKAERQAQSYEFDEARATIRKIYSVDRDNKKARYLEILCEIIPKYEMGVKAFETGLYRDAYTYLNQVTSIDAAYKDALKLRDEALSKSRLNMAYLHIRSKEEGTDMQSTISGAIKGAILDLKNPFIRLIERDDLTKIVEEQMLSMGALMDEKSAIAAGKLMGARFIITGQTLSYSISNNNVRSVEKRGFMGPNTDSRKIKYTEYHGTRSLQGTFKFQILDAETGEIFESELIPLNYQMDADWALFGGSGDSRNIYPGDWKFQLITSRADYVDLEGKQELDQLFANRSNASSESLLLSQIVSQIATKVARAVNDFQPRK
jgi:hypothetical protein